MMYHNSRAIKIIVIQFGNQSWIPQNNYQDSYCQEVNQKI